MKKILSLLLSVAMIATMLSAFGLTASAAEYNGKTYSTVYMDDVGADKSINEVAGNSCIAAGVTFTPSSFSSASGSVTDVYRFMIPYFLILKNDKVINVYDGGEFQIDGGNVRSDITTKDYKLTVNLYGGTVKIMGDSDNIIVNQMEKSITPDTATGDSNLSMSGKAIPTPTYTVTIPKSIDFGTCDKAMANDTAENRIKTIDVNGLSITHSNLYANEKQVTVTLGSDFKIKNGENTLDFELYDSEKKLAPNTVLMTANPTEEDNAVNTAKPLTAKLDKSQIKKSGTYTGTVTFTVAMSDAE